MERNMLPYFVFLGLITLTVAGIIMQEIRERKIFENVKDKFTIKKRKL